MKKKTKLKIFCQYKLTAMFFMYFLCVQADEKKPVLVPGDPESTHMEKVDKEGGIQYHVNQLNACDKLADKLKIPKLGSL